MKKLKVAIIGQGRSGRNIHGRHLMVDQERFQITAVVEKIEERRQRAVKEFNCDVYNDYTELFGRDDLDLIVNASFSDQHASITLDLLNHGFNVLVEKPVAKTPEEVQEMIDASEANNVMFAAFQQSRFAPYFIKICDIIDSGVLGRIIQIKGAFNGFARRWDWQCCQDKNGGGLMNTGPHLVDQALQLLNTPDIIPNIFCRMDRANTAGDANDYAKIIMTAPNRPLIDLEISSCDAYKSDTYIIQGTNGGLHGTPSSIEWRYFNNDEVKAKKLDRIPLSDDEGLPIYCSEELIWTNETWEGSDSVFTYSVRRLYDTVYDNITKGTPLVVTPQQIKQQIAVMQICHQQNPLSQMDFDKE